MKKKMSSFPLLPIALVLPHIFVFTVILLNNNNDTKKMFI